MSINQYTELKHKKGGEYEFIGIIHPYSEQPTVHNGIEGEQKVFHTELGRDFVIRNCFNGARMISYSNDREVDEYMVLYQSKLDVKGERLYARPIQMFFEHVEEADGSWVRRFEVNE